MTEALVPYRTQSLEDTMTLGKVLAASGYFADSKEAAQAVVKVLAGSELGFGPIASMTGVNIIKGKVSLSANLIAAAIKRSGRYNYRVRKMTDTECTITFFENGEEIGVSTFTAADAKTAGLNGDNWRKFPRNMLFARAISNGAKWYCPDLSGGPLYTPDELGATVDGETGEVIDAPVAVKSQSFTVGPRLVPGANDGEQWEDAPANGAANGTAPGHDLGGDWDDERKRKAVDWAMRKHPDVFGHRRHAENALNKVMTDNPDLDNGELAQAWIDDCERRQTERDETFLSDAEMDEPTHADLDAQAAAEA